MLRSQLFYQALRCALATSVALCLLVAAVAEDGVRVPSLAFALPCSAFGGALLGVAQVLLGGVRAAYARLLWVAAGCWLGVVYAERLGAFRKLGGEHGQLAVATLIALCLSGVGAGGILAGNQPARDGTTPFSRWSLFRRSLLALLLTSGAMALAVYETTAPSLRTYPSARQALVGLSWISGAGAALLLLPRRALTPLTRRVGVLAAAVLLAVSAWRVAVSTPAELSRLARTHQVEHLLAVARALTDWDRDGSSGWLGDGDCQPWNARVHPRAREIPGNGLDDNCGFGDAAVRPVPTTASSAVELRSAPPATNFVLITVDALRADHTTPYGYHRNTTPNLARFAGRAVRYHNAYSPGSWTCVAVPSMLTGVYARRLTWEPLALTEKGALLPLPWQSRLAPDDRFAAVIAMPRATPVFTLQSSLRQRGMTTLAVVSQHVDHLFVNFVKEGWDTVAVPAAEDDVGVTDLALEKLTALGGAPFFLWVHYFDPHWTQTVHPNVPQFGDTVVDRYDHEVASSDYQIGRLLDALAAMSSRPTAIAITADHGEGFQGDTQFHGANLRDESVRIPLMLEAPLLSPAVSYVPASLVDIPPTFLALAGVPIPTGLDGRDLRELSGERVVLSDLWRLDEDGETYLDEMSATGAEYRLAYDRLRQSHLLTRTGDVARPPREIEESRAPQFLVDALGRYQDGATDRL